MTEQEERMLAFEEEHPVHTRTKEALIREQFAVSPARFYQVRNRVLRTREGVAAHPVLARSAIQQPLGLRAMFPYSR